MTKKTTTRGVIFDLDGTLYTLPARRFLMAVKLWRDVGVLKHVSGARGTLRGRVFEGPMALREAFVDELGRRAGVSSRFASIWYKERFMPSFVDLLSSHAKRRSGLNSILDELRAAGVRTAVVSDFDWIIQRLEALGLDPMVFDDLVAVEQHGVLKPSPIPFVALANKWNVSADSVVVIGDRDDLDARSADMAGMQYIGVTERRGLGHDGRASWKRALEDIHEGISTMPGDLSGEDLEQTEVRTVFTSENRWGVESRGEFV